jgi:hypothetical protein
LIQARHTEMEEVRPCERPLQLATAGPDMLNLVPRDSLPRVKVRCWTCEDPVTLSLVRAAVATSNLRDARAAARRVRLPLPKRPIHIDEGHEIHARAMENPGVVYWQGYEDGPEPWMHEKHLAAVRRGSRSLRLSAGRLAVPLHRPDPD